MDYLTLLACLAAFSAGFMDAIVGGGGLIQAPAMFIIFPKMPVLMVIGTNRASSIVGTFTAGIQYARKISIAWKVVVFAGIGAVIFAYLGAYLANLIPQKTLKGIMILVMCVLAVYTFLNKGMGQHENTPIEDKTLHYKSIILGAIIGFYNGLIGPGTGTLLVFAFVIGLKFSFLQGSGISKFVNVIADAASLFYFLTQGLVLLSLALPMMFCNITGSYLGSRLAVWKGNAFIRIVFLVVVVLLMLKFGYDWLMQ